jgi:hypothetical protein
MAYARDENLDMQGNHLSEVKADVADSDPLLLLLPTVLPVGGAQLLQDRVESWTCHRAQYRRCGTINESCRWASYVK